MSEDKAPEVVEDAGTEQILSDLEALAPADSLAGADIDLSSPEAIPEADNNQQTIEMLSLTLVSVFAVVSIRAGEHWQLTEAEAMAISEPGAEVLEKYLPGVSVGAEAALAVAVGGVVLPRIMLSKQKALENQEDTHSDLTENQAKGQPKSEPKSAEKNGLPVVAGEVQVPGEIKGLD